MIGKLVLNYEIKSIIGEGGMGSVYLAEHTQVNRKVAIKVLKSQFTKNEEIKARFKNEASTMAHLNHPNIVSLFDYLEDDSGLYLIMEYVEGKPLDEYIELVTGPMPGDVSLPIFEKVLSAFNYAHEQGVVHRDIKPANIIIGNNGQVKVLDFGIARLLGDIGQNLTKTGTQMGTVFYMSPEQVQGKKVDQRSDIYSLGVTFYQMLTGINPYKGITTEYEVYNKIVKEDLPNPKEIYPGVPDFLSSILRKALQKDPSDRFQSCADFLSAIHTGESIVLSALETNNVQKTVSTSVKSDESKTIVQKPRKFGSKAILLLLIAFAIMAGGLYSFIVYNKDTDGDGVIDRNDKCLTEFGHFNGCPDQDRDGVLDSDDACPYDKGSKEHNGCPDSDGDSVFDNMDECDDEKGDPNNSGCPWPDADEDGTPDKDDSCPEESGPADNEGCPYVEDYEGDSYVGEGYLTNCPHCDYTWNLNSYNKMWICDNCYKNFFNCFKESGEYGAIKGSWVNDGGCDCNNCADER